MSNQSVTGRAPTGLAHFLYKTGKTLKTPMPYLAFVGIGLWLFVYFLLCEYWRVFPFFKVPDTPYTLISLGSYKQRTLLTL